MTGLREFHTSVFSFATKVMMTVECQRGGSNRSSHFTATIAFAVYEVSRVIATSHSPALTQERCVVVWGSEATMTASGDLEAHVDIRSRAGPLATYRTGNHDTRSQQN